MKKILGLDLGTNSIGWALVEQDFEAKSGKILGKGIRVIPMSQEVLGNFDVGNSVSQTAERTKYRGTRRLRERHLLRRERLHRILNVLGFLPEHYASQIDFKKWLGQFSDETEPKIAWKEIWNEQKNKNDFEFIFQNSFNEMVAEFKHLQPQLFVVKKNGKETKIPYDWTIYYLRKKALCEKIEKDELAWIILNFNQKRGYYQLRGEEEEKSDIREYVQSLKIVSIKKGEKDKDNDKKTWYKMTLENGWEYSATFTTEPHWLNTEKEFLITEELDENGNIKIVKDKKTDTIGKEKRRITPLPSFDEINLMSKEQQDKIYKKIKARTEITIQNSGKTVGTYIYETLLKNPTQKIRGKLVRTIERKFYKDELVTILEKQIKLQPELFTEDLYNDCIRKLYKNNEAYQLILSKKDFVHLFVNDIIFYQRPLKGQKSSIGNCSLEYTVRKVNKKDDNGNLIKNVFEKDAKGEDIKVKEYLKAVPKSNPHYQEFRIWQWLYNLKIYQRDDDKDVTNNFLKNADDYVNLFDFLMNRKEIDNKNLITYFLNLQGIKGKNADKELKKYRWNYVFDNSEDKEEDKSKKYPCNETKTMILNRLTKVGNIPDNFLKIIDTKEIVNKKSKEKEIVSLGTREYQLWHIIYSVTDKIEFEKALKTFANKYGLDEISFVENFKKFPPFKSEYGSFSEKAIKKLLPLMRLGKYWNWEIIDIKTKDRISKIINGEYDETIKNRVRDKAINLKSENDFQGLQLWLAQYIAYNRHSESANADKWNSVADLEKYLEKFKQYSLRNPIVEQVIIETLRVVRDIWNKYGDFSEIHIELGREMKNTAEDRKKITNQVSDNENTNLRVKAMLMEFAEDSDFNNENNENTIRPYSQNQQDILKIYEEDVLRKYSEQELKKEVSGLTKDNKDITIFDISKRSAPTKSEIQRYKLWLEQKYKSPYTGQIISLVRLFTTDYEIEHIIPQSRYFDDSLSNKVICETTVNKLKDRYLGLEFIKKHAGEKVECGSDKVVEISTEENYKNFVQEHYKNNNVKRKKLLLEDIPDKMIERQLNDTRYISKFISQLLSNIVREDKNDDGVNSKNLISGNGKITDKLKKDWGLKDTWDKLILPRFERMNKLTDTENFTSKNQEGHIIPVIPFELSKGFQKKRIDHRHHAMDALIIACATRNHINLLNNQSANSENSRYDLQNKLRNKEKKTYFDKMENKQVTRDVFTEFKKPWDNFTIDARNELEKIVASFKQNLRIISKTTNKYYAYDNGKKVLKKQEKGDKRVIRKPLHKDTVYAKVYLLKETKEMTLQKALEKVKELKDVNIIVEKMLRRKITEYFRENDIDINLALKDEYLKNNPRIKVFEIQTAVRKSLDTSFTDKKIKESVTDSGIQKILLNHLSIKENKPELAFSLEGIEEMNKNIVQLNNEKFHQPIYKVRVYESLGNKFQVGTLGNKRDKYVEAEKGTNLFFAIYTDKDGKRFYETIQLNKIIDRLKQKLPTIPETNEDGYKLLFYLNPNDLVYVPKKDEIEIKKFEIDRIYKFTDSSGSMANFVPANVAKVIFDYNKDKQKKMKIDYPIQNEFGVGSRHSKNEKAITGEQIKKVCLKLKVDRLGNVKLDSKE